MVAARGIREFTTNCGMNGLKSAALPYTCGILRKWTKCCFKGIAGGGRGPGCHKEKRDALTVRCPSIDRSGKRIDSAESGSPDDVGCVAAVVAAAGFSSRMGRFKPLLPWRHGTVIESVASALSGGGASPVYVVTGHRAEAIAEQLKGGPAKTVFNADYHKDEMVRSYQVGIEAVCGEGRPVLGALLALGDQPHMQEGVIRQVIGRARAEVEAVVVPSYKRRRGHPVYLPRWAFGELLGLTRGQSLRDLLDTLDEKIVYETVDSDCVRRDMDIPAEYESLRADFEWVD